METGIIIGWAAPNIAKFTTKDAEIQLDEHEISWIVSIDGLGAVAGSLLGSACIEFSGSRLSVLTTFLFLGLSWICMIIADSLVWVCIARFIGGIGQTSTYCCFAIYLGEIADPKIRGTMISIAAAGNPFGILIGTILETYLTRKISSIIYLIICLLSLALFFWLKDSPNYLIKKGKYDRAKESVQFYRSDCCDVEHEINELKDLVKNDKEQSFSSKFQYFKLPIVRKSMILIIIIFAFPHLSGFIVISSYMEIIFKEAKINWIDSSDLVIYANIVGSVSTLVTFKLIDVLGRRALLVITSLGTMTAMIGLGMHFLLIKDDMIDAQSLQWLPIVCIFGYLVTYAIGYSTVPSAILGELFADNVKSIAALVACTSASFFVFFVGKTYVRMVEFMGQTFVFWIYAILTFMATPFALIFLPETKGKTFWEIQNSLVKR